MKKIYSGIYTKGPNKKTDEFIMDKAMIEIENKLLAYYFWETIAHNLMLYKQGIVTKEIAKKILKGLITLSKKMKEIDPTIGDIHENVENKLIEVIGGDAGWFHTARSRNDQVITDQKLITKKYLLDFFEKLSEMETVLLKKSEEYKKTIIPGYTHLRPAMPSTFGFWWQSCLIQILDLHHILNNIYEVYDKCPLGAGVSYGVNWRIDPKFTATKLGFSKSFINALSAINNRGIEDTFIISNLAVFLVILSRMMEDLIIWSLPELNYVVISEEFTTGSSIMPQKMNPDVAEKIRSKSAKLIGNLNYVLAAIKGTPSGYNRDSAESKIAIVNSLEETIKTINVAIEMLDKVVPNAEIMKKAIISTLPTKLVDELVKEYGLPFRTAHKVVGKALNIVGGDISKLTSAIIEKLIKKIAKENKKVDQGLLKKVLNVDDALKHYQYEGSPNPFFISKVNKKLKEKIELFNQWAKKEKQKFKKAEADLYKEVNKFLNNHE